MDYAIIRLGGKQYRVREGEYLVVDRVKFDEGKTFNPDVLLGDSGVTVTAKVLAHERGPKIRIGKYRKRTGYKRHAGHRSHLTRIEIESIGAAKRAKTAAAKPKADETPAAAKAEKSAAAAGPDVDAMTIPQITEAAAGWSREEIEAALEQERVGKARKGALAALESALEDK